MLFSNYRCCISKASLFRLFCDHNSCCCAVWQPKKASLYIDIVLYFLVLWDCRIQHFYLRDEITHQYLILWMPKTAGKRSTWCIYVIRMTVCPISLASVTFYYHFLIIKNTCGIAWNIMCWGGCFPAPSPLFSSLLPLPHTQTSLP